MAFEVMYISDIFPDKWERSMVLFLKALHGYFWTERDIKSCIPNLLLHYIIYSHSTRFPSQKPYMTCKSFCMHATQNPLGLVSYSGSSFLSSFLILLPSLFTLQMLLSSLLEYCSCDYAGLPASHLLSPAVNWSSLGHGDFSKTKS